MLFEFSVNRLRIILLVIASRFPETENHYPEPKKMPQCGRLMLVSHGINRRA